MNNNDYDLDESELYDDYLEDGEYPDDGMDYDLDEPVEQPYSENNKFGRKEWEKKLENEDYYKDERLECEDKLKEAEKAAEESRRAAEEAKSRMNEKKGGDKEEYKAAKEENKLAQKEMKNSNKELKTAKKNLNQSKFNKLKSSIYEMTHPVEAMKSRIKNKVKDKALKFVKDKVNDRMKQKATKELAKQATKEATKKAAAEATKKAAAEGGKKAAQAGGKAIASGAKSLASAMGKAIAAAGKAIGALLVEYWWVVLIVIIVLVVLIAIIVIICAILDAEMTYEEHGITGAKCEYNINGITSDTKVELINCEATKDNYTVLATIPFEKYVAGVAIAEMGENYVDEAMKAQLIAVRSYTLTRNIPEYGVGYNSKTDTIRMRACENDQVYWNYEENIYQDFEAVRENVSKYSPEFVPDENARVWKYALSESQIKKYEAIVSEVLGQYLVDANGNVVASSYNATTTDKFTELAENNAGNENGKYTSILLNNYSSASSISTSNCTLSEFGEAGEYSTWKQSKKLGAPWSEVKIGDTATIGQVGCLVTSIAIQIAHSGVDTGDIIDFNPGTFAQAMKAKGYFSSGGGINSYAGITEIVPSFKYTGRITLSGSTQERYNKIRDYANQGYYIVIEVKKHIGGQHWVALDAQNSAATNWEEIYMWDPGSSKTKMSSKITYKPGEFIYFSATK